MLCFAIINILILDISLFIIYNHFWLKKIILNSIVCFYIIYYIKSIEIFTL